MKLKRIKRCIVSKNLKILRAFIDAIRVVNGDIFVSVAYRKGRAFCRYDGDFNLKYRVEEECLSGMGFGDYRGFAVDEEGNFILTGLHNGENVVSLFRLDKNGKVAYTTYINDIGLLESMAIDSKRNLYLHSPLKEAPVYRYSNDLSEVKPVGEFPSERDGVSGRIAQIAIDKEDNLIVVYETSPAIIQKYSPQGKCIFEKIFEPADESIDLLSQVLDFTINPDNNNLYVLLNELDKRGRPVKILNPDGDEEDRFFLPSCTRRIHITKNDILYSSGTIFGLPGILLSWGIYGAITLIDKYRLQG
ncbi:MAG: hypothetical protein K8T10_21505 [Candidatus Eremiobacteraeota bacterium]|nr:hypothetical protein [Candidatus Eremiobacteraeota bacterium]